MRTTSSKKSLKKINKHFGNGDHFAIIAFCSYDFLPLFIQSGHCFLALP